MSNKQFTTDEIFSYNLGKKKLFALSLFLIGFIVIAIILVYLFFLRYVDFFIINGIEKFIVNISSNISSGSLVGALYASLFGGLFFIFMPMEAVFIKFLNGGTNPLLVVLIYIFGFFISFTINYYIGMRLANITRKIITAKKFYNIKVKINRFGGWAIFLFNLIPLMPAQPLSAIIGVFKYNKTKFYVAFISGQLIKYILIVIGYVYIS